MIQLVHLLVCDNKSIFKMHGATIKIKKKQQEAVLFVLKCPHQPHRNSWRVLGAPHCDLDGYRFQVTNPFGLTASSNCWHSSQNLQEYKNHSSDLIHESTQATTCVLKPIDPVHHTNCMYHLLKHSLSAKISHLYASPDLQYQHR
jgi:hypothetical protein